jgi:hypothetical protein
MNINNYNEVCEKFQIVDDLLNDYVNYGDDEKRTKRAKIIDIKYIIKKKGREIIKY